MKNLLKIILVLTAALFCISASAANPVSYKISGRVLDKKSMEPIPGATVLIEETYLWAVCGRDGEFSITGIPAGNYKLRVSSLGYDKYLSLCVKQRRALHDKSRGATIQGRLMT